MNKERVSFAATLLLGLLLAIGGINGFLRILPVPMPLHPVLQAFDDSGFLAVVKFLELIAAAALCAPRFRALGLVLSAPIVANIVLFHIFFDGRGLGAGVALLVLWGLAAMVHRSRLAALVATETGAC